MAEIVARQDTECAPSSDWYVCSGGFRGCCSVNPCGSGCPDSKGDKSPSTEQENTKETISVTTVTATASTSTKTTRRTTTTEAATTTTTTDSSTTKTKPTLTSSDDTSQTTTTSATSMSETPNSKPTSIGTTSSSSQSHTNSSMIGGIVGGIIGLLLILCIVAFLVFVSRKKRGKRFTLLHWRCPRTEYTERSIEDGNAPSTQAAQVQAQNQQTSTAVRNIVTGPPNNQPQSIPEEQSPDISPLQSDQNNSPRTIASVSSPSTVINPRRTRNSCSKSAIIAPPPDAIHPAFRETAHPPTAPYLPPTSIPETTTISTTNAHPDTTPELFDTGFYLGRLELPASSSRELINIPFNERQRQRQRQDEQKQIYRAAGLPSPIITPGGAILSANFNSVPVDPDSHAMSFMDYDSASELKPPTLAPPGSPPPVYRSDRRRGSFQVKERMMVKFRRRSKLT
ncbi:hypothetical protein ASPSYDRAFT_87432 [Aspergillus sydowii CBS 593.65]|uniref:Mid2 domain-containing protein n=1 Tax=Aspergillus sydowii CBS 593.65 TaxID=1036612 RepID=A0A1L9TN33_9EURO|nr:uncharacterized protein ASPSYDRAFT_87432 [Aspergillus sydowii CBS 593.65]OJJ60859.1 hypothetical protein ASPSYDRAFT_87432 [Aspergillus sydowii CBS 593.65]